MPPQVRSARDVLTPKDSGIGGPTLWPWLQDATFQPEDHSTVNPAVGTFGGTGKVDPRFQAMSHGGDLIEACRALAHGEPLAKSGAAWTLADYRRYRAAAGYPPGARHEAASVMASREAGASDLVLHLIAAHHGFARPCMPWWPEEKGFKLRVPVDGEVVEVESWASLGAIDSPIVDRFWSLCSRHGMWGLAFLEAVLRLADHAQSREENYG